MQPFTQKYAIIQLLEEAPEGMEFSASDWPLHVTLVDVFASDWSSQEMAERLTTLLTGRTPATATARDDTYFGPSQDVPVTLLDRADSLAKLHGDVYALLERGGLKMNNPQFALTGFQPHATVQEHAALKKGDTVVFDALTIIDMFPGEDPYMRKVLQTIKFGV